MPRRIPHLVRRHPFVFATGARRAKFVPSPWKPGRRPIRRQGTRRRRSPKRRRIRRASALRSRGVARAADRASVRDRTVRSLASPPGKPAVLREIASRRAIPAA
jgi:hypothetical protein